MKVQLKTFFKKYWPHMLAVMLLPILLIGLWVLQLDHLITTQFEGRRWTLPAKVYAQPLELYAGESLSINELQTELRRLGYDQVAQVTQSGSYQLLKDRINLVSRPFRFMDDNRPERVLTIAFNGDHVRQLWDNKGQDIPVFRLDPLLIGSIFPVHGEDRIIVTPDEVPPLLPAALKAVEDRRFDSHIGVDPLGILRALWIDIRHGHFDQGGSTLTQQLVRSYFLNNQQTLSRKITEAVMAILLEAHFDKADLMNAYINEIHLGQDGDRAIHGFGLASEFYFGKPLRELQLNEIALLVTEVRSATYYNPRKHPERALARRNMILDILAHDKLVSVDDANRAKTMPLGLINGSSNASNYYPAFLDFVRRTLHRDYKDADLTEAGLTVFTTLDPRVQKRAEDALTTELNRLDKAARRKNESLEGAVVVVSSHSGEVNAIVGGRQVNYSGFDRALDATRSIGSLAKPVVYLTAIQSGRYNASTIVNDVPVVVKLSARSTWAPENFEHVANGPVPVVRALSESLNLATVNVGLDVGVDKIADEFTQLGLGHKPDNNPSIILGAVNAAPIDVAQLYETFANDGFRTPLRAVRAVLDENGKPLQSFPLQVSPAADPAAVYQINRMMVDVVQRGTAASAKARLGNLMVAGKTGTSSDYRDSWFSGFSGSHLAVVWVGYDDNSPTRFTGSAGALPVWTQIMTGIDTTSWDEPLPDGVTETMIDFDTGMGVTPQCDPDGLVVAVPQGTQPQMKDGCNTAVESHQQ
ncbi:MAG TPA: penicillin-binding protein 1B [Steroidobacteraceae bacterium]|jgi:penicillin-binding protein 1B|nr:penicillin-binding protein 1B [Steroidobacteraceae bacterium]